MKAIDYLTFVAQVFFAERDRVERAVSVARQVSGLGERLNDKLGSYSKGMTRKLLLARTVMTEPKLAILDEPTSGLDVLNALEIRDRVRELARQGMSVLLSSHNMLEIEYLSDRVGIIDHGVIRDTGTAAQLKERHGADNLETVFGVLAGRVRADADREAVAR
jgi:ABC-2 type transport system ATP-binding protein